MTYVASVFLALAVAAPQSVGPGDHRRTVEVDGQTRSYLVHIPPRQDPNAPSPVVLAFHGAFMNARQMVVFTGLNQKADAAGFVAVYPDGIGVAGALLFWNAGGVHFGGVRDDVKFTRLLLDDLGSVVRIDPRRVFATGLSNGGMMCHRLAAELSDRIAAVAPVAGTLAIDNPKPARPISVIHFHGTADTIVPFDGPDSRTTRFAKFKSVDETIRTWIRVDGCPEKPDVVELPNAVPDDGTTVQRKTYGLGKEGAQVVLVTIRDGGHTWPGQDTPFKFLGKSTKDVAANDLMWEFFQKHPLPARSEGRNH